MPTQRRRATSAAWLLRDINALVHAGASWEFYSLYVKFSEDRREALFSIRLLIDLEGFDKPQTLCLLVRPENLGQNTTSLNHGPVPRDVMARLTAKGAVTSESDVLVLALDLNNVGRVLAPSTAQPISPTAASRDRLAIFSSLCQATSMNIYLAVRDMRDWQQQSLRLLVDLATAGQLRASPVDARRLRGGGSMQEADWRLFSIAEPPPLYADQASQRDEQAPVAAKRMRATPSSSPSVRPTKRRDNVSLSPARLASPGARTHVSDSEINPTPFMCSPTPAQEPEAGKGGLPGSDLRQAVREVVEDMLSGSTCDLLEQKLDSLIAKQIDARSAAMMPDFLASLVEDHMDNFIVHLDDMQTGTELTLGEFVDDAKLELMDARSQCLREAEEMLQYRIEDVREAADEIGEEVGSRFVEETEELGDRMTDLTQAVRRVEDEQARLRRAIRLLTRQEQQQGRGRRARSV